MKKIYLTLIVISSVYLMMMWYLGHNAKKNVLGTNESIIPLATAEPTPTSSVSPTPTPTPTPSTSPTPSPTIKPLATPISTLSPTPTPTPTPSAASSSEINSLIERFAGQYGVDPNVLRYIALCESGFKSNAENADYIGLYQFGSITWKNIRAEIGEDTDPNLRYSAEESVQTASYAFSKGKGTIWPNCIP